MAFCAYFQIPINKMFFKMPGNGLQYDVPSDDYRISKNLESNYNSNLSERHCLVSKLSG